MRVNDSLCVPVGVRNDELAFVCPCQHRCVLSLQVCVCVRGVGCVGMGKVFLASGWQMLCCCTEKYLLNGKQSPYGSLYLTRYFKPCQESNLSSRGLPSKSINVGNCLAVVFKND